MGCGSCSTGGGCTPAGCKSNGTCLTNGCSKLDVYDWLSNMDMPANYKAFNIVEIKFKGSRKDFYINHENLYVENGELVVTGSRISARVGVLRVRRSVCYGYGCCVHFLRRPLRARSAGGRQ